MPITSRRRSGLSLRVGLALLVGMTTFFLADISLQVLSSRQEKPRAMHHASYWTEDFAATSRAIAEQLAQPRLAQSRVPDLATPWINVRDGRRVTTPELRNYTSTVWAVGGSTTFGVHVPDDRTWPSQLAAMLQDRYRMRVVNLGIPGATLFERLDYVQSLQEIRSGDTVVFYSGVNEAVTGRQGNTVVGPLARMPRLRRLVELTLSWSWIGRRVLASSRELTFTVTESPQSSALRFIESAGAAHAWGLSRSISVHVILQPNALLGDSSLHGLAPDFAAAVRDFYRLVSLDPRETVIDARFLFDNLRPSPYLDWCHVEDRGNERIAKFVFGLLKSRESRAREDSNFQPSDP